MKDEILKLVEKLCLLDKQLGMLKAKRVFGYYTPEDSKTEGNIYNDYFSTKLKLIKLLEKLDEESL